MVTTSLAKSATTPDGTVPPLVESPQVTTLPSLFKAAKAPSVEYMVVTPLVKLADTSIGTVVSPPVVESPHTTTDPSIFKAANASTVE
jgi:hypothetical protein